MGNPTLSAQVHSGTEPQDVWYVAYGSNILDDRLNGHQHGSVASSAYGLHEIGEDIRPPAESRWIEIDYPLYFAGESVRWAGAVAFISLKRDPQVRTVARAYRISASQLVHLMKSENAVPEYAWNGAVADIPEHRWVPLPVASAGPRGKYNAALRLSDIDGMPALTLTTARAYRAGPMDPRYRDVLSRGLSLADSLVDVEEYLKAAIARSPRLAAAGPTPPYVGR